MKDESLNTPEGHAWYVMGPAYQRWSDLRETYAEWHANPHNDRRARLLAISLWHLSDHLACAFSLNGSKWQAHSKRKAADGFSQKIVEAIEAKCPKIDDVNDDYRYWMRICADSAKHGKITKHHKADDAGFNNYSDWDGEDLWETFGRTHIRNQIGLYVAFNDLAPPVFEAIRQVIEEIKAQNELFNEKLAEIKL